MLSLVGFPTPERSIQARCRVASSSVSRSRGRWRRRPSLLLLDEPLSALDAKVRERLRGEIRQLQRRLRVTTIMVTHDQEEALSMADRVVVMNDGVIEQVAPPAEVYERAATPFVADFLGKVNVLKATSLGGGQYRVGSVDLTLPIDGNAAGESVRIVYATRRPAR